MYRGRLWTMRQYAGFGTAAESNRRYRYLLEQGVNGLSVAFDLPTQMGYDSDHPLAAGEVGRVGVAIDSIEDMHVLMDGIPLDQVSTSMTINAPAAVLLLMYQLVAEENGVPGDKITGTIQNDILKEYIARGTYIFPPKPSLRLVADTFAYCRAEIPRWNTISISGYHMAEAGATPAQEVAFTLANGRAYVQAALAAGLGVDAVLLRDELVEQEQCAGRGVDRHRRRHLVERDAVEQRPHVVDRVDRDADLADLAVSHRVVGVVAHLGRQVEGDRQAAGAGLDQPVVALVGLRGGAEPGVLAHRPRAAGVHRRVDATGEREGAGLPEPRCWIPSGQRLRAVDGLDRQTGLRLARHGASLTSAPVRRSADLDGFRSVAGHSDHVSYRGRAVFPALA